MTFFLFFYAGECVVPYSFEPENLNDEANAHSDYQPETEPDSESESD